MTTPHSNYPSTAGHFPLVRVLLPLQPPGIDYSGGAMQPPPPSPHRHRPVTKLDLERAADLQRHALAGDWTQVAKLALKYGQEYDNHKDRYKLVADLLNQRDWIGVVHVAQHLCELDNIGVSDSDSSSNNKENTRASTAADWTALDDDEISISSLATTLINPSLSTMMPEELVPRSPVSSNIPTTNPSYNTSIASVNDDRMSLFLSSGDPLCTQMLHYVVHHKYLELILVAAKTRRKFIQHVAMDMDIKHQIYQLQLTATMGNYCQ